MRKHAPAYLFFALLSLTLCTQIHSQDIALEFRTENKEILLEKTILPFEKTEVYLTNIKDSLNRLGYLEAGVDSIHKSETKWVVYFHTGRKIEKAHLLLDNETASILSFSGIRESHLSETAFSGEYIHSLLHKIAGYWENRGHPFAVAKLRIVDIDSHAVFANVLVDKGKTVYFDTFDISGNARITSRFLSALTEIKPGKPYNESLVRKLDQLMRTLPFVRIIRPSTIVFIGDKAKPIVYLEHRNNDFVDGIIGFAPPAAGGLTPNQNLLITGELRIRLGNLFKGGESLDANARFFNERSQELKLRTEIPYIAGTKMGVEAGISGIKFDTLFSQIQGRLGISYFINGNDKIKFFFESQGTTLITVDTNLIKATRRLPANQSMAIRNYGIETVLNRLDYLFNPRKGMRLNGAFSAGTKTIRRDNRINSVNVESAGGAKYNIYDSTVMNMLQYRYAFTIEKYTKIGKSSTLKTALQGEGIISPAVYFNELIRFGGVYTLRGFNEQSLFASNYTMLTVEYRYLLGQNGNLFAFWNGAYYEDNSVIRTVKLTDLPFGFGVGANLETGAGILTLAYAMGRESNNPIRFQAGKFHFGLIGLF